MNFSTQHPTSRVLKRWHQVRGIGAVLTVVAFFGTAVVAPFSMPPASAEEVFFATRDDRLHQEFVPEEAGTLPIDLGISPVEEEPKAEPEPEPEPEREAEDSDGESEPAAPAQLLYTGGGSPAEWMAAAGIAEGDWGYVDFIVSKESGWNPNAVNPSSGASGLVQALPCGKVPGSCFDPVDNLRWADGYAKDRYGSWSAAYAFWQSNSWW